MPQFILPLEEISKEGKNTRKTSHEKNTYLGKSCVTMIDLMDKFYETTELSGVICDNCTKSSLTTRKSNLKKNGIEISNETENISSKIPLKCEKQHILQK